ncbi:MAG: hypothetical protein WAT53_06415, partial [Nitrosomonas sp.]
MRELTILTAVIHLYAAITHALAGNHKCIGNLAFLHENPVKHFLHFFSLNSYGGFYFINRITNYQNYQVSNLILTGMPFISRELSTV